MRILMDEWGKYWCPFSMVTSGQNCFNRNMFNKPASQGTACLGDKCACWQWLEPRDNSERGGVGRCGVAK